MTPHKWRSWDYMQMDLLRWFPSRSEVGSRSEVIRCINS